MSSDRARPDKEPGNEVARRSGKHREIRSFVRRAGRMTRSQTRAWEQLWPVYGLDYDDSPLEPSAVFGRSAPLTVELGFGNGESLVEMAAAAPDTDFLGIEVHEPGIGHSMIAARAAELTNLRLICHDGIEVLRDQLADGSIKRLNLYFADPWPKKRHHKRRIVQPEFVELVAAKLEAGGDFYLATDWADYAEHIDEIMAGNDRLALVERRLHRGDAPLDRPSTKFERRGLGEGHEIVDWHYRKVR